MENDTWWEWMKRELCTVEERLKMGPYVQPVEDIYAPKSREVLVRQDAKE